MGFHNLFLKVPTAIVLLIYFIKFSSYWSIKQNTRRFVHCAKVQVFTDPQIQHVSLIYLPLAPKCNRCVAKQKELFAYLYLAQVWRLAPAKLTDSSIYYYSYLFTSNKTLNFFGSPNLHPTKVWNKSILVIWSSQLSEIIWFLQYGLHNWLKLFDSCNMEFTIAWNYLILAIWSSQLLKIIWFLQYGLHNSLKLFISTNMVLTIAWNYFFQLIWSSQ